MTGGDGLDGGNHCECALRTDWGPEDVECSAEHPEGYICTRPEGHDGPHSGCYPNRHPAVVWRDA